MKHPRTITASAAIALTGAAAVLLYVFWWQILYALFGAASVRLCWQALRHQLGIRSRTRSGKSLWEVAAASLGGYIVGRRGKDAVAEAIHRGAEVQIRVPPKPSRYRA